MNQIRGHIHRQYTIMNTTQYSHEKLGHYCWELAAGADRQTFLQYVSTLSKHQHAHNNMQSWQTITTETECCYSQEIWQCQYLLTNNCQIWTRWIIDWQWFISSHNHTVWKVPVTWVKMLPWRCRMERCSCSRSRQAPSRTALSHSRDMEIPALPAQTCLAFWYRQHHTCGLPAFVFLNPYKPSPQTS